MEVDITETMAASPVYWAEQSHIKLANGDEYSFKDRPYLIDPLVSEAANKVVRKATQLGFSETFILESNWGCISGRYPQGLAYIFPNDTEMKTFVQSRYNTLIKRNYEAIGKYVRDTDTTYYKRIGESNLFFDGGRMNQTIGGQQKESAAIRSKPYDKVILDEYDLMDEDILQKVDGRMGNSLIKAKVVISNPTVEDRRTDKLYKSSNQNKWYRWCKCGEFTCSDDYFPDLIDKEGCHCYKCGRVLTYTGRWKPDFPNRNDLYHKVRDKEMIHEATDWDGYTISQLNSKTNSAFRILQDYNDPPNGDIENFWKLRMGRAYTPKENKLTLVDVYNCCENYLMAQSSQEPTAMGFDVGKNSFHYVIGIKTGSDTFDILRVGCVPTIDDISMLALSMNVKNCIVDIGPEYTLVRKFQMDMRDKIRTYLCQYSENPLMESDFDMEKKIVKAYRTGIFDTTHRLVLEKRVRFPYLSPLMKEFARQYVYPYKYKDENRQGTVVYRYSRGGDDHYRNAMNYFYLAAKGMPVTTASSRRHKKADKCIYEGLKI